MLCCWKLTNINDAMYVCFTEKVFFHGNTTSAVSLLHDFKFYFQVYISVSIRAFQDLSTTQEWQYCQLRFGHTILNKKDP